MSGAGETPARPAVGKIRTADEHADLLTYHFNAIRKQRAAVETAQGPVKTAKAALTEEQEELTKRFNEAKVDLGSAYTREYMTGLIRDGEAKTRDLVAVEKQRAKDKPILGQPVFGLQPELFPGEETPTAARDEMAWMAEGYQRGLRGDLTIIQKGDPPEFHQAIQRAFDDGQKVTRERVARAMEAKAKQGQPDATQQAVDLNPPEPEAPEPGTPEAKAAERKAVRKAKEGLDALGAGRPANEVPA